MSASSSKFSLKGADFRKGIKRAFILYHFLSANQSALHLEAGRPFTIINPPANPGYYRLSVRELHDGIRWIVVGDNQND